ncbi:unnamed protein product [Closterium sp. NIES-53]
MIILPRRVGPTRPDPGFDPGRVRHFEALTRAGRVGFTRPGRADSTPETGSGRVGPAPLQKRRDSKVRNVIDAACTRMEGEEDSSRAIPGASLGGLPTPASRASFRLGSVFNGQEIGWDDAIATRRREEVREWESLGPGPKTEEQGTRGKEKDPDWRPAPGEAAGTSGGSGDEGWGGRGAGQAGGSGTRGSGAAAKRPRPSGPVGSGAGGAGPASNSQPQGAAAGGSEGSGAAGAGTSAAAAGGAPLGGSTGAGAAAVIASQRSDRAGRTLTDEELDPWTEEVLRNAEPGLVRGMFSEKDVNEARNCKICKKKISWKGSKQARQPDVSRCGMGSGCPRPDSVALGACSHVAQDCTDTRQRCDWRIRGWWE